MIKLNFSAVSQIGELKAVNEDRIYASGKFTGLQEMDNVQLAFEERGKQFVFAVSEGMESDEEADPPHISINSELYKFQKKTSNSIKDVKFKLDEMFDCVEQLNNLLYSLTIGNENKKDHKPSFSGIFIEGDRAAAVVMGNFRAYKLEPDNLRPIVNDYKRTERLLKMGIITDEQAEYLSSKQGALKSDNLFQVRKSDVFKLKEGDVLLLCSDGLIESVEEEAIHDMLASDESADRIAYALIKKAMANGAKDNVTASVIRVLSVDEESVPQKNTTKDIAHKINKLAGAVGTKKVNPQKLVSTAVMVVVLAAVVFGTYSLVSSLISGDKVSDAGAVTDSTYTDATNEEDDETGTTETSGGSETTDTQSGETNTSETGSGTASTYTVKKGDSLFLISKKFYGDPQKYTIIMEANNIKDANKIQVGQVLTIPALEEAD